MPGGEAALRGGDGCCAIADAVSAIFRRYADTSPDARAGWLRFLVPVPVKGGRS